MIKRFAATFLALSAALWVTGSVAESDGHHHRTFPKDIDAFHALLAPIWHAPPGNERSQNACVKVAEMEKSAMDIRTAKAKPLIDAITNLKSKCASKPSDVDPALFDVHEAFHGMIDPKPSGSKR